MSSPHSTSPPPPNHVPLNTTYSTFQDDDLQEEPGFSDLQTVALACFLTLLPLMFGLVSYFGFRVICKGGKSRKGRIRRPYVLYCWGRFRRSVEPSDLSKALDKESSHRNRSSQGLLNEQLKSSESQFSVVPAEDIEEGSACYASGGNQTSKATANGSIITMTMKNNHLIVETETAIVGDGSMGAEMDGNDVLVVEVAPAADSTAIVHQIPPSVEEETRPATGMGGCNTGLSTSDLSCSSESLNRGYMYGNQSEYESSAAFEVQATQQLICHIVAPVDTYLEPVVPAPAPQTTESGGDMQLELTNPSELKGETNPAYVPTPVTTEVQSATVTSTTVNDPATATDDRATTS